MLRMPQWSKEEIEGLRRCFVLYVKLPKSRWPEVQAAEKLTPEGGKVLGEAGPIQLELGQRLDVAPDGSIKVDGDIYDRLRIVDAAELRPQGASQWRADSEIFDSEARIVQGALEGSNADPIQGMTDLIQTSRYFEMYQKAMQTSDEMDRKNIDMADRA